MKAGHPAYFIGFLPDPMPGQTILDIAAAEAVFLETVIARHPGGRGQALRHRQLPGRLGGDDPRRAPPRALRPDHHRRHAALLLGGRARPVPDALLRRAAGRLVADRARAATSAPGSSTARRWCRTSRNQNPANTLWTKQYNLWSKIDTEPERYLDFEKWWGGHVTLNAEEMQWIVDELFVGNHLAAGEIRTPDGTAIDLRNDPLADRGLLLARATTSPRRSRRSTGSSTSTTAWTTSAPGARPSSTPSTSRSATSASSSPAGVARKEHDEFASNIDLIDVLPPGLYEAVLTPEGRGGRQSRPRHRRMGDALRGAHPRRHPRARRQRPRRRAHLLITIRCTSLVPS